MVDAVGDKMHIEIKSYLNAGKLYSRNCKRLVLDKINTPFYQNQTFRSF